MTSTILRRTCSLEGCHNEGCLETVQEFIGDDDDDLCLAWAFAKTNALLEHLDDLTEASLTDEEVLMLPYEVMGYVLRRRKWGMKFLHRMIMRR